MFRVFRQRPNPCSASITCILVLTLNSYPTLYEYLVLEWCHFTTALHAMQTRSSDEKVVCPSLCQTRESGPYAKGGRGYWGCNLPPLNLSEVKFSGSAFGSCTTVTAQFSSFVHQCGCSQFSVAYSPLLYFFSVKLIWQ